MDFMGEADCLLFNYFMQALPMQYQSRLISDGIASFDTALVAVRNMCCAARLNVSQPAPVRQVQSESDVLRQRVEELEKENVTTQPVTIPKRSEVGRLEVGIAECPLSGDQTAERDWRDRLDLSGSDLSDQQRAALTSLLARTTEPTGDSSGSGDPTVVPAADQAEPVPSAAATISGVTRPEPGQTSASSKPTPLTMPEPDSSAATDEPVSLPPPSVSARQNKDNKKPEGSQPLLPASTETDVARSLDLDRLARAIVSHMHQRSGPGQQTDTDDSGNEAGEHRAPADPKPKGQKQRLDLPSRPTGRDPVRRRRFFRPRQEHQQQGKQFQRQATSREASVHGFTTQRNSQPPYPWQQRVAEAPLQQSRPPPAGLQPMVWGRQSTAPPQPEVGQWQGAYRYQQPGTPWLEPQNNEQFSQPPPPQMVNIHLQPRPQTMSQMSQLSSTLQQTQPMLQQLQLQQQGTVLPSVPPPQYLHREQQHLLQQQQQHLGSSICSSPLHMRLLVNYNRCVVSTSKAVPEGGGECIFTGSHGVKLEL
ncbi:transcriptional regulator DEF1-like [Amphibalanus amphitrite]|uniref:transcriptional regulator DEF1-like n=1 Tax=Amphibalanus amphitrite TaxID=1232801 RepID=UPI001C90876B|nr:transcriptional regulator DEF1-like [Amphibalanus amphitrite]